MELALKYLEIYTYILQDHSKKISVKSELSKNWGKLLIGTKYVLGGPYKLGVSLYQSPNLLGDSTSDL